VLRQRTGPINAAPVAKDADEPVCVYTFEDVSVDDPYRRQYNSDETAGRGRVMCGDFEDAGLRSRQR
jgi:hypothetical protein